MCNPFWFTYCDGRTPIEMVNHRRIQQGQGAQNQEPPPDPLQMILDRLREQQILINQIIQRQEEQAKLYEEIRAERNREIPNPLGQQIPPQPEPPQELFHDVIIRFNKHHPPSFDGHVDVVKAESWIKSLERIFDIIPCSSEQKALMAIYKLENEVIH